MKKFIKDICLFGILLFSIILIGLILPATPRASKSLLFAKINKDKLLKETPSPRIIFIGGSNLSFGLNSQTIKDSLNLNPINTAIHASIGLSHMLKSTLPYVQKNDIIIIVPEYDQFYKKNNDCSPELTRTILDVNKSEIQFLKKEQYITFIFETPKYAFSKFNPIEYFAFKESDVYSINSFNQYGDASAHWNLPKKKFLEYSKTTDKGFNNFKFAELIEFKNAAEKKGAMMLVSFPGFQEASFNNNLERINRIENEYKKEKLTILGTPERYKMADSLMFNTPLHLNKKGVDKRTQLFIEDFRNARTHNILYK